MTRARQMLLPLEPAAAELPVERVPALTRSMGALLLQVVQSEQITARAQPREGTSHDTEC